MNKGHRTCEICGLQEKQCNGNVFFGRFPSREHICKQWVKIVGKEDLAHLPIEKLHDLKHLCGRHFKSRHFTKTKTRLKKTAVPTLHLTMPPLPDNLLEGFPLRVARKDQENITAESEHNYSDRRHYDHTYCHQEIQKAHQKITWDHDYSTKKLHIDHSYAKADNNGDSMDLQNVPGKTDHTYSRERFHDEHSYIKKLDKVPPGVRFEQPVLTRSKPTSTDKDNTASTPGGSIDLQTRLEPSSGVNADDASAPDEDLAIPDTNDDDDFAPPSPVPEMEEADPAPTQLFSWEQTELIPADEADEPAAVTEVLEESDVSLYGAEPAAAPPVTSEPSSKEVEYHCKECGEVIEGFQFWCVQCFGCALCGACEARGAHHTHYVLRAPPGRPHKQTRIVLAAIRHQLQNENMLTHHETDGSVKLEVKEEPIEEELRIMVAPPPDPDPLACDASLSDHSPIHIPEETSPPPPKRAKFANFIEQGYRDNLTLLPVKVSSGPKPAQTILIDSDMEEVEYLEEELDNIDIGSTVNIGDDTRIVGNTIDRVGSINYEAEASDESDADIGSTESDSSNESDEEWNDEIVADTSNKADKTEGWIAERVSDRRKKADAAEELIERVADRRNNEDEVIEEILPVRSQLVDAITQALTSKSIVELRPLSSVDIRKWTCSNKRKD